MRPRTSVRQPVIAGAGKQQLSEMLRRWRSQSRKRSVLLFWTLLAVALLCDTTLLLLGSRKLVVSAALPTVERQMHVPYAADAALWEPLRHCAARIEGRTRLLANFCGEAVKRLTGDERFEGRDPLPLVASWMLDGEEDALQWDEYPLLLCEEGDLRAVLYSERCVQSRMTREEQRHGRYVEPLVVASSRCFHAILGSARRKHGTALLPVERQALELQRRFSLFQQIRSGKILAGSAELRTAMGALREAYQSGDKELIAAALSDFLDASVRGLGLKEGSSESRRLTWERWLHACVPARLALYGSLLAAGLFMAAALVRPRRPRLHRGLFLIGVLASLGCLGWAGAEPLGRAIWAGALPVHDGRTGVLWLAGGILGLGLVLTALFRDAFLALTGALVSSAGFLAAIRWPLTLAEWWPTPPDGVAGAIGLQVVMLLSAYSALALGWGVAALTLARVLLVPLSSERLHRLTALCVETIRLGIVLLAASAFVECCRGLDQGFSWDGWNALALSTFVALPSCAALVHARRRGWMQPFALLVGVFLGLTCLAITGHIVGRGGIGKIASGRVLAVETGILLGGILQISIAAHAALRYYFSKQRILTVWMGGV